MKALKLKSSPDDNPIFGSVEWTEVHKGATYIEAIYNANDSDVPDLFSDRWEGSPSVVNEPASYGEKWEFVPVKLTLV